MWWAARVYFGAKGGREECWRVTCGEISLSGLVAEEVRLEHLPAVWR